MNKMSYYFSDCCDKPAEVKGDTTKYMICTNCGEPCNPGKSIF